MTSRLAGLIQRGGVWYFNKAWPLDLQSTLGKAPFRVSLRTTSRTEALARRPFVEQDYWARIKAARGRAVEAQPRALPDAEIQDLCRWFLTNILNRYFNLTPRPEDSSRQGLEQRREHVAVRLSGFKDALARGDYAEARIWAEAALEKRGINADRAHASYAVLCRDFLRLAVAHFETLDAQLKGVFGFQPADPLFQQTMTVAMTAEGRPEHTINDLIDKYSETQISGKSASTQAAYQPVFRLLRGVLGENRAVSTLTRADGELLFATVKALPVHLGKRKELRGLTLLAAVEKAKALGLPTLNAKSINDGYMVFLQAMFGWAVREDWLAKSPVQGLKVEDQVADEERRDPFSPDQLRVLFASPPWDSRAAADGTHPARFWVPLLCLFHGLRLSEAAGLRVEDVSEREGHPVLLVRAYAGRSLKTSSSRGVLPLHGELRRLGFLAFVEQRRQTGETALFPDVRANVNGKVGAKLGEWFSRHVVGLGFTGTKLGMHSFRHNFEDRLREAELPERTALALARRKETGSRGAYGEGLSVNARAAAMERVAYPGLDLSHLYPVQPGGCAAAS